MRRRLVQHVPLATDEIEIIETDEALTPLPGKEGLASVIAEAARGLGFAAMGVTSVEPLLDWRGEVRRRISDGMMASRDWLRRKLEHDPREILPGAASVLVFARAYTPYTGPFPPGTARYAAHYVEYPKGLEAVRALAARLETMGFDAVPQPRLPAKALAVRAGLGSYGRNSLVYCSEHGSFVTLHTILTTACLEPDPPAPMSTCGDCDACTRACPSGALGRAGALDMRKCVRAHMGQGRLVPEGLRRAWGTSILGCEACALSCPRNSRAVREARVPPAGEASAFSLAGLLGDSGRALRSRLEAIAALVGANYARQNRILADAAIAAGNTRDPDLVPALARSLEHRHAPVRAHSAWALGEIGGEASRKLLERALVAEADAEVRAEIERALHR